MKFFKSRSGLPLSPLWYCLSASAFLLVAAVPVHAERSKQTASVAGNAPKASPFAESAQAVTPPAQPSTPEATSPSKPSVAAGTTPEAAYTVIEARERLFLDSKGYQATFVGQVTVNDPRFYLSCDKLVAYLKRPPAETKPGPVETPASAERATSVAEKSSGGVEKAEAVGNVVIVQEKVNEKGEKETSVGRAKKAVYDAVTQKITLFGRPQVQQKGNTIVSTDESTVMVLDSKGSLDVQGPSKSVLRNTSAENGR